MSSQGPPQQEQQQPQQNFQQPYSTASQVPLEQQFYAPRQAQPQQQQQWPQAPSSHAGYGQESFPIAPQHVPAQKAIEESLIEL
jgi:growth factor-regulated tyrosine kinase substrate